MSSIQEFDVLCLIESSDANELVLIENADDLNVVCASLAALANTSGGVVFIGVNENNKIRGIDPTVIDQIRLFVSDNISPKVSCEFALIRHRHFVLIQISVFESTHVLSFKDSGDSWKRTFMFDGKVIFANEVVEVFLKLKMNASVKLKDDTDLLNYILGLLKSNECLSLTKIMAKTPNGRNEVINQLGRLLFDKKIRITIEDGLIQYKIV